MNSQDQSTASPIIRYWISGTDEYPLCYHEDGDIAGIYPELISRLEAETGKKAQRVRENDGAELCAADALDMLETGELDLVLGLPEGLSGEHICVGIYDNVLTAVIEKSSPMTGMVENCYWGIDTPLLPLTEGTRLEGHVLDYNGTSTLFNALETGMVYGILVKRSILDDYTRTSSASGFAEYSGIKLPYRDSIYINSGASELAGPVKAIAGELEDKYGHISLYNEGDIFGVGVNDASATYYNRLNEAYSDLTAYKGTALIGVAAAVILACVAAYFGVSLKKAKKLNEARMRTLLADEADKELFEIDLAAQKIYAYKDFTLFGVRPGSIPNPIKLDKLSDMLGYDFTGHYSKVPMYGSTLYKNRFIIYAGGKRLYITENGKRTGNILAVTMTLINQ